MFCALFLPSCAAQPCAVIPFGISRTRPGNAPYGTETPAGVLRQRSAHRARVRPDFGGVRHLGCAR